MTLQEYETQVQLLLYDVSAQFFSLAQIDSFINFSRRRTALLGKCVRWLTPSGAGQNQTVANQEVYPFSALSTFLPPGASEVIAVRTVAIQSGTYKPAWVQVAWSRLQADARNMAGTWKGTLSSPGYWALFGSGSAGSIYLAPIPTTAQPMEWDCALLPADLSATQTVELIPDPWADFVQFGALVPALASQGKMQESLAAFASFKAMLIEARAEAENEAQPMQIAATRNP